MKPGAWEAFRGHFDGHIRSNVSRTANSFSIDEATIQDLVQDVYVRLVDDNFGALRRLRGAHANSAYAYFGAIAVGVVIDHGRRYSRSKRGGGAKTVPLETLAFDLGEPAAPANQLEQTLLIERIDSLLQEILPEKTRIRDKTIFWLKYRSDYTASMISKVGQHGLSEKGIESLLKRIVDALKEKLN